MRHVDVLSQSGHDLEQHPFGDLERTLSIRVVAELVVDVAEDIRPPNREETAQQLPLTQAAEPGRGNRRAHGAEVPGRGAVLHAVQRVEDLLLREMAATGSRAGRTAAGCARSGPG